MATKVSLGFGKLPDTRIVFLASLALGLFLIVIAGLPNGTDVGSRSAATAQTLPPTDVYSAKFLCGNFLPKELSDKAEWPVKPGNYFTTINVHNPNRTLISFQKKAVLLYRADKPSDVAEQPMPPSELIAVQLKDDWGLEIDCSDIRNKLLGGAVPAPAFIEGWVVIEVKGNQAHSTDPIPLDVTAVYTGHGWIQPVGKPAVYEGFAENVVPVLPKRVR